VRVDSGAHQTAGISVVPPLVGALQYQGFGMGRLAVRPAMKLYFTCLLLR
jgi:hypothetical protein